VNYRRCKREGGKEGELDQPHPISETEQREILRAPAGPERIYRLNQKKKSTGESRCAKASRLGEGVRIRLLRARRHHDVFQTRNQKGSAQKFFHVSIRSAKRADADPCPENIGE